jgi:pimeloyl-ACP methyl ester carboxylesterase
MNKNRIRMLILGLWLCVSFWVGGCNTGEIAKLASPNTAPLIFIHGFKGAELRNKDGALEWMTGAEALSLSNADLRLPLKWDFDQQVADGLHAGDVLSGVRIIPGLIEKDVYKPWLKAARAMNCPFYTFTYDWRRDLLETLSQLNLFVAQVRKDNPGARLRAVGHSMGGLLLLAYLNQHPDYFQSIIFAGVPFVGGSGFLLDLHAGVSSGLNDRILSREVLFTFPAVYSLFSLSGSGLVEKDGTAIPMDYFSVAEWKAKKLGVFSDRPRSELLAAEPALEDFLRQALVRAKKFRELLVAKKINYPPILVISSHERPTLENVMRDGPKSGGNFGWDFETAAKEPGDGRVSQKDSLPPSGIPYRLFYSESEHSDLLNDPKVITEINQMLNSPREKR